MRELKPVIQQINSTKLWYLECDFLCSWSDVFLYYEFSIANVNNKLKEFEFIKEEIMIFVVRFKWFEKNNSNPRAFDFYVIFRTNHT